MFQSKEASLRVVFKILIFANSILFSTFSISGTVKLNLESWGSQYVPKVREFDPKIDTVKVEVIQNYTPFKTRSAVTINESNLEVVGYSDSKAKIAIFEQLDSKMVIEITSYKSFSYQWINEDLISIESWPGRCVNINMVYDFSSNKVIYLAGYQHCGLTK